MMLPIGTPVKIVQQLVEWDGKEADMASQNIVRDDPEPNGMPTVEVEPFRLQETTRVEFSPLEDQVIELARADRLGSLETPGRIERLFAFLFGLTPGGRPLADPRLEALRRAVVVAHHRHHLPDAQAVELKEQGFSLAQVRMIELRAIAA
jgi:hypothetical protein